MTAVGFHVFVRVAGGIQFLAEVVVGLDEEVGVADADPQESGLLREIGRELAVDVLLDLLVRGRLLGTGADGGGEHAGVIEHVRVV